MKSGKSLSRPKRPGGLSNAASGALRATIANPSGSWTVRIIKAVFCAFFLLLAVRLTVVKLLPKNRFLYREFTFQIVDSDSRNRQSRLWDRFGRQQENIILELAQNTSPALSRELIVTHSHSRPGKLILRMSCPYSNEELTEEFRRLITDYTEYRRLIEAEWAARTGQPQIKSETLPLDQIRQSEEYNQRLQELILLQSEYARMDAQSMAYEHQLLPAKPTNNPIGFREFMQPHVQCALALDEQCHHLNQWLNKLRRQRAELDIKCGQCDSAEQLEILLQQRKQIDLQYNQEKRNLKQRRELVTEMVRLECWGRYQKQLKTKIQEKQQALIANSDQQLVLKMEIDRLESYSDYPQPSPTPPVHSTDAAIGSRNLEFRPRFIETAKLYKARDSLSHSQYLIMTSAALLGAALGWFIGPGRPGQKKSADNSLPERTEKAQQDQPKPKEQPHEVTIQPVPEEIEPTEVMTPPEENIPPEEIFPIDDIEAPEEMVTPEDIEPPEVIKPQEQPPEQQADNDSDIKPAQEKSEEQKAPTSWSDQIRHLTDTVERFRRQVDTPVILLAASEPDTTSPRAAVNLSIALTHFSLEILLVEADLDRHDLVAVFELPESPGFYEWRRGEIWASNAITPTSLTGLSFMHVGSPSPEQCNSEADLSRESHRWNNLRRNYDVIVIYCPAALSVPSESSSAEQLASAALLDLADGVFVLTSTVEPADNPPPPQIETLLENRRAQFLGSIGPN